MRWIFSFEQSISNAFAKNEKWESFTESFVKVSRVMSAVQKKETCGKILDDMLRAGQHENTNTLYCIWRQQWNNSFLYRGKQEAGTMLLVCFQESEPSAISWPWTNGWGTFQGNRFISWPWTDEAHFRVANSFLYLKLMDEAHFRVANAFLDRKLMDEAHFRGANSFLYRKLKEEAHFVVMWMLPM